MEIENIRIGIIGLGYVGLPLACLFAKRYRVDGLEICSERVDQLLNAYDVTGEVDAATLEDRLKNNLRLTTDTEDLRDCNVYVICVSTPVDDDNNPDLTPLRMASATVGGLLKKGDVVIYESSVFPGCTEQICVPMLSGRSGLTFNADYYVGYSPERINPGDREHTVENITKIVSGSTPDTLDFVERLYNSVLTNGTCRASSIRVAEAAKVVENTQRDVNIALMNELSIIFDRMGINTYDVLEAAGTKWNFLHFSPGLVGGHCIGVDPYYLVHKAKELQYHPKMINSGRFVNDSMGRYIGKKIVKKIISLGKNIVRARVLIMGITFKENVSDIRNSKVVDMIHEFQDFGAIVDVIDPLASPEEVRKAYNISLLNRPTGLYDAIVVAVAHKDYLGLDENYFLSLANGKAVLGDVKGVYRHTVKQLEYWSL